MFEVLNKIVSSKVFNILLILVYFDLGRQSVERIINNSGLPLWVNVLTFICCSWLIWDYSKKLMKTFKNKKEIAGRD
jgi:hypothetical protein